MVNEKKIRQLARRRYNEDGQQFERYIKLINVNRDTEVKNMFDIVLDEIERIKCKKGLNKRNK